MRKIIFAVLSLISFFANAQDWSLIMSGYHYFFGGDANDNGNYLVGCLSVSGNRSYSRALVMFVDNDGNYSKKILSDEYEAEFLNAVTLPNGDLFVTGIKYNDTSSYSMDDAKWQELIVAVYDQDLNLKLTKFIDVDSGYMSFSNRSTIAYGEDGKIAVAIREWYFENHESYLLNKSDFSFYLFDYDGTMLKHNVVEDGKAIPYSLIWRPLFKDYMMTCRGFAPYGWNSLTFIDNDFNLKKSHSFTDEFPKDMYVGRWRDENEFIVSTHKYVYESGAVESSGHVLCPLIIDTTANIKKQTIIDRPDTLDYAADQYSMTCIDDSTIFVAAYHNTIGLNAMQKLVTVYLLDNDINLLSRKDLHYDFKVAQVCCTHITPDNKFLIAGWGVDTLNHYCAYVSKISRDEMPLLPVSVDEAVNEGEVLIYPNPANDVVTFAADGEKAILSIFDALGKKVLSRQFDGEKLVVDLNNLTSGLYIYIIEQDGEKIKRGRFVKQ